VLAALIGSFRLPPGPADAPRGPLLRRLHSARAVGARALACGLSARAADAFPAALQPARDRGACMRDDLADRLRAELDARPRTAVLQKSSSSSHSDGSSSAGSGRWTTTEGAPQ